MALIGLSAMTHSINMGQRHVGLDFEHLGGKKIEIRITDNPDLVPPGYYMLFVLSKKDRPSEARMLQVTAESVGGSRTRLVTTSSAPAEERPASPAAPGEAASLRPEQRPQPADPRPELIRRERAVSSGPGELSPPLL